MGLRRGGRQKNQPYCTAIGKSRRLNSPRPGRAYPGNRVRARIGPKFAQYIGHSDAVERGLFDDQDGVRILKWSAPVGARCKRQWVAPLGMDQEPLRKWARSDQEACQVANGCQENSNVGEPIHPMM